MDPSRLCKDGVTTLVKANLVRKRWGISSAFNLDVPHVKSVKSYQRRKRRP